MWACSLFRDLGNSLVFSGIAEDAVGARSPLWELEVQIVACFSNIFGV